MHGSLLVRSVLVLLAAPALAPASAPAQELGLDVDLDLVVEMPLAVADAYDAGVPLAELTLLSGALIDGEVTPTDFLEVLTLAPIAYRADLADLEAEFLGDLGEDVVTELERERARDRRTGDEGLGRRAAPGPGLGEFVQRQLDRGLRGTDLADAIHRELRRRGAPAGPGDRRVGVRGGDRVARDLRDLDARDRPDSRERVREAERGRDRIPPGHARGRGRGHGEDREGGPPGHAGDPPDDGGNRDPGKREDDRRR